MRNRVHAHAYVASLADDLGAVFPKALALLGAERYIIRRVILLAAVALWLGARRR